MVKRKSIQFILVGWFTFSIFLSYSGHFVPISPFYYLPIGVGLIAFFTVLKEIDPFPLPDVRIIVILILLMVFGLLATRAPNYGIFKITVLTCWFIFFLAYANLITHSFNLFISMSIFWGLGFLGILFVTFGDPYNYLQQVMKSSARLGIYDGDKIVFNPIWVARHLGYLFIIIFYSAITSKKFRVLKISLLFVVFLYMIATGSKGPIIAVILGLGLFLLKKNTALNFKYIALSVAVGAFCVGILYQIGFFDSSFFQSRFSTESSSVSGREGLISSALGSTTISDLVFGNGTGDFGFKTYNKDTNFYPHNIFAEVFYENGIVGLIIFALFVFRILLKREAAYIDDRIKILYSIFIFFVLNAQFSGDISGNQYLFFSYILFESFLINVKNSSLKLENQEKDAAFSHEMAMTSPTTE